MKIKIVCFLIFSTLLISCNEKKIYNKLDKNFPENRWQKSEAKTFEFSIDEEARNYDVNVRFAYFSDFLVNPVPITVTIIHPDNSKEKKELNIVVIDKQGKETGDCGGDYCDIREIIFKNEPLKKGIYQINIQQNFSGTYLPNVNGVGIEVIAKAD